MQTTTDRPRLLLGGLAMAVALLATTVVVGWAAPVSAGTPTARAKATFTGGQQVAPYGAAGDPSVASNGTYTMAVWSQQINGTYGVFGRIMSSDTTSIGGRFKVFYLAGHDALAPDVAWNGSQWLVVFRYSYSAADSDIRARLYDGSGAPATSDFGVETATSTQYNPAVTGGPDGQFLVAWEDGRNAGTTGSDIYASRVASGTRLDSPALRISNDPPESVENDFDPDVAWSPGHTTYAVAWDAQSSVSSRIRARKLGPSGILASGGTEAIGDTTEPVSFPAIASNGSDFMITYQFATAKASSVDIWGVNVDQEDRHPFPISQEPGDEREPTIAYNGLYLVAWTDRRDDPAGDIYLARVKQDRSVLDPTGLGFSTSTASDLHPALTSGTSDARTFGVAWQPSNDTGPGVVAWGASVAPK
ncbi:MAG: hypothetical protein JO291_03035 [Acidimicrobiia bacterium]|nr:hypothetical protein [Acidimicrobiia bacterium]